jgi:hypothetical protein
MTEAEETRPKWVELVEAKDVESFTVVIANIFLTTIFEVITDPMPIGHDFVNVTLVDRAVVRLTPTGLVIRPIEEMRVNAVAVAVLGTVDSSLMIAQMEVIVDTTVVDGIDVIMSVIVPILRLIGALGVQVTMIPGDEDTTHEISVRTRHRQDLTFDPHRLIVGDRMQRQRRFQQSLQLLSLQLPSSVQRRHTHIVVRLRHHDLLRLIRTPQFPMRRRGGKRCSTPRRKSLLFRWMRCRYRLHIYQCCKHFRSRPLQ